MVYLSAGTAASYSHWRSVISTAVTDTQTIVTAHTQRVQSRLTRASNYGFSDDEMTTLAHFAVEISEAVRAGFDEVLVKYVVKDLSPTDRQHLGKDKDKQWLSKYIKAQSPPRDSRSRFSHDCH